MYRAVGVKQGVNPRQLAGTIQNDILKEYEARNTYIFRPAAQCASLPTSFSIAQKKCPAGTRFQFRAITLEKPERRRCRSWHLLSPMPSNMYAPLFRRGLDVDDFAPQLSFFFVAQMNFFEEVAKFRAARRLWAKIMKNMFNAKSEKSMNLRFHVQTAGSSLTLQQPDNNIVRTTLEALAAALGGCQSLHTNSKDEAIALPTEAVRPDSTAHTADHCLRIRGRLGG
jgi:methylmalonyl-CoA mutase N-terminal domain/subunit